MIGIEIFGKISFIIHLIQDAFSDTSIVPLPLLQVCCPEFLLCEWQAMVLMLFSNASNHPPWKPPKVMFTNEARVRKVAYVAYVRTPTFISVRMILDMCTLILTPIFTQQFVKGFKNFLVLILLYI